MVFNLLTKAYTEHYMFLSGMLNEVFWTPSESFYKTNSLIFLFNVNINFLFGI